MGRRRIRGRAFRFALSAAIVVIIGGVAATVAQALAFNDAVPCSDTHPVFVCPQGTVETSYSITFQSAGGCGPALPYQYRVLNGSLPPGLSLSSSGTVSGTPTTAGDYDFWVELSDEDPPSASWCFPNKAQRPFSIKVLPRLLVTTESAGPGTIGAPYTLDLTALMKNGANSTSALSSPVTWSVVSGQLPPGVSLNSSTGVVSGTPTAEGSFLATYKAALADGRSDTKSLAITVRKPLNATASKPLATTPAPTVWEVGVPFSAKLTPSGGSGTFTFALGSGTLPTGIVLGPDGTVSGTPRAPGEFRAAVKLTDSEGRTLDYAVNFGVAARLAVSTAALKPGKVGKVYRAKLALTGGLPMKKWKVLTGPLPKGIHFDPTLGTLAGTPTKAGSYRVTFQVTDGLKVVAKKTLRIVVDA